MHLRRTRITIALAVFVLCATPVAAQFSAGLVVGEPTGLSAKLWVGDLTAVDLAVAWSVAGDEQRLYLHSDFQQYIAFGQPDAGRLLVYVGVGGRLYIGDETALGVRIPVGLFYELDQLPIEVFLEVAPGINLFPATEVNFGGGIGARYRF